MKTLILIIIFAISCSFSCRKPPFVENFDSIVVANASSLPIRVLISDEHSEAQYPDTSLPELKPALSKAEIGKSVYYYSRTTWREILEKLPADTLSVTIIDNYVYENEPWDSVRDNYKILKRYDLSIQDLIQIDYIVTYP